MVTLKELSLISQQQKRRQTSTIECFTDPCAQLATMYALSLLIILLAVSFRTPETHAASLRITETREKSAAFDSLERTLREVLEAISCRELTSTELGSLFEGYATLGNISSCTEDRLDSLEIPDKEDCRRRQLLHFLDYREEGSDPECLSRAFPRLRLIPNATEISVFPAYYMDWKCSSDCDEQILTPNNFELLQRTNTCSDYTADWKVIEAARPHSLNATSRCVVRQA